MKKFRFLLLDANIVIYLHELGLWDPILDCCDITLAQSILDEVKYYHGEKCDHSIDLSGYVHSRQIQVVEVELDRLKRFINMFGTDYLERLDPGEAESLAYLYESQEEYLICSSDSIVFKVLPQLQRTEQGISLEEILNRVGLTQKLAYPFTKAFREKWVQKGREEWMRGTGLK